MTIHLLRRTEELAQREAVIAEARTWLGTPFHHAGRVKGAGVDCAQILIAVYEAVGVISEVKVEPYSDQWHLHQSEEKYLGIVGKLARELGKSEFPLPGDVAVFRFGRAFSHAAIIIDWPTCIHAYIGRGVELVDVDKDAVFTKRAVKFFTAWK